MKGVTGMAMAIGCFAWLFGITSEVVARNNPLTGQTKCLGLIFLLVVALRYPFRMPECDEIILAQ